VAEPINVWAFRVFVFKPNKAQGWTHTIHFDTLADLLKQLRERELQGRIAKLVIVAHGDSAGLVQLDRRLTVETSESFAADFKQLSTFLAPEGKLMFESCQAGADEPGSLLLKRLSTYLNAGQTVIGFIVNGLGPGHLGGLAGDIFEAPNSMPGMPASAFKGKKVLLTEDSVYAKWARAGKIVRLPVLEEFAKFKGSWTVIALKGPGKMSAEYSGATFAIGLSDIRVVQKGKTLAGARYKANLTLRPRTLDVDYTAGVDKGKQAAGILEFGEADFDSLKIALSTPAKQLPQKRPPDFSYPPGASHVVIELKRHVE
jgi:uncharacterized protein (TIGR03067 family)